MADITAIGGGKADFPLLPKAEYEDQLVPGFLGMVDLLQGNADLIKELTPYLFKKEELQFISSRLKTSSAKPTI